MSGKVSSLEAHLGYWLRAVSNQVSSSFSAKVTSEGVTVAEWVVLRELFDMEPAAPSRVAGRLGMTRGAISKLAERLLAKALISRAGDASDARRQVLALTAEGRALVPRLAAIADENDAAFFGHLEAGERAILERIMRGIANRSGIRAAPVD